VPKIDDKYKSFLWEYIKMEPELGFFRINTTANAEENSQPAAIEEPQEIEEVTEHVETEQDKVDIKGETIDTIDPIANVMLDEILFIEPPKPIAKPKPKNKGKSKAKPNKKKPKKSFIKAENSEDEFNPDENDSEESSSDSELEENDSSEQETAEEEEGDDDEARGRKRKNKTVYEQRIVKKSNPQNFTPTACIAFSDFIPIENIQQLSYSEIMQLYGNNIYVIASQKLQTEQLFVGIPVSFFKRKSF
jgi:hypothetical protein